mmetsp:Transcript_3668/g.8448  ORF Transcript_3668/g.8448 Transcript_3668/m.8448 type:complete len:432 (+) Transcript_3668:73-1368(+)
MKKESNILDAAFEDVWKRKQATPSIISSAASTNTVQTSNAAKPVTIDGSRLKFAQQILYSAKPDTSRRQKKIPRKKKTPILQSTPSLASAGDKEAAETNGSKQEPVETKEESRDTVSSPHRAVAFDHSADHKKEEKPLSLLSDDSIPDHQAMIEQRLSTSMCNEKEMREGVYQNVGTAVQTSKGNTSSQMKLQKLQRPVSKDSCDESEASCSVPVVGTTMNKGNDGNPFDQLFRFVEKTVCGKIPAGSTKGKEEESSLEEEDPFDCECVVSDVHRSANRKGATRVILQVKKVLKSSKARRHNKQAPAFSSLPIAVLERENSVLRKDLDSDLWGDEIKEQDGQDGDDGVQGTEGSADGVREEPEPVPELAAVKYQSAEELLSSRCRERLADYRRETGRSVNVEEDLKEVPAYPTKMTKKEIIDRERLRAQYF